MEGEEFVFKSVEALCVGANETAVDYLVSEEVIEELTFTAGVLHGLDEDLVGFISAGEGGSEVGVDFSVSGVVGEDLVDDAIELFGGH